SFMPWLAGTALLHSAIVVEKRDTMKAWTIFLAILAFSMSLLGTFLVRSGVLTSVHAFATDPERGVFILMLLLIVIGGSLTLFAMRGPALRSTGVFKPVSREGGLLLNNLVMSTGCAVVLLGTLYPLFLDAIGGAKVSVGPPFFNSVFIPLMVPMFMAMGFGPLLSWKRSDLVQAALRLKVAFIGAGVVVAAVLALTNDGPFLAILGLALAAWIFTATLVELGERIKLFRESLGASLGRLLRQPRASWGMTLAHLGMAITIAGMAGAGGWKVESIQVMKPGETVNVAGYDYTFKGARQAQGPNYTIIEGIFQVTKDGRDVTTLKAEKRNYPVRQMPTTEAAIYSMISGDLYAVIGDPDGNEGGFVTRIYFNPLIAWMWVGSLVMVFGGVISISDRRYRIGAPARRARKPAVVANP
ncbi:MAG: cytochrome c biogenesis protein CcsA, partial [Rhodospirillales bacterium]|nr:cytochrome c biogenesis protein CcsA [Rhodospirillales bacterium]